MNIDLNVRPRIADMKQLRGPSTAGTVSAMPPSIESTLEARPSITPPEAFEGRTGYDASFLGEFRVDLPTARGRAAADILKTGTTDNRLDYLHFSVVMSQSRRMALFVGCNIDGAASVKVDRANDKWSYDGRIPLEAQIGDELYARNDIDRGHLVRREDPNWGEDAETANGDTFHFTNCSPQMAAFNQHLWLGLEDYVLQNARTWKDRVTVFTGPVFSDDDMIYRDVPLPSSYWKVLAFIDERGRPSATAYMLDQKKLLKGLEAAYGRYKTYQRSISLIEELTGLSFGKLRDYDGFSNEEDRTGTRMESAIRSLADIRV